MAVQDTFNGAKSGLTFMQAYLNTVGQEIGMEKALALETKTTQMLGKAQGMMLKKQAGVEEVDIKTAEKMLSALIEEALGIPSEVTDESPTKITCKVGRCPVYLSAEMLGMDNKAIEASCKAGSITYMDTAAKQLNPKLSYKLTKFRSSADDFCEETVVME